ncbi:MAG: hypothetical protein M5R36_04785 [Deltaproteobacteria bacterium]|nr:hypothetical protein [Deltaproteobacteria bacterium]
MAIKKGRGKGKILQIRYGINPNSSSLGADVQVLIWGAAFASVATIFLSAMLRVFRRWRGNGHDA